MVQHWNINVFFYDFKQEFWWNRVSVGVTVEWRMCFPGRRFFSSSESTEMITSAVMEGSCLSEALGEISIYTSIVGFAAAVMLLWISSLHSSPLLSFLLAVISVLKRLFKLKGENLKWVEIMNGHTCFTDPESAYQHLMSFSVLQSVDRAVYLLIVDPNNTLQVFLCWPELCLQISCRPVINNVRKKCILCYCTTESDVSVWSQKRKHFSFNLLSSLAQTFGLGLVRRISDVVCWSSSATFVLSLLALCFVQWNPPLSVIWWMALRAALCRGRLAPQRALLIRFDRSFTKRYRQKHNNSRKGPFETALNAIVPLSLRSD